MKDRSQVIKDFKEISGEYVGFKTSTGFLFTDGKYSLEVFRVSNTVSVFEGNRCIR